MGNLFQRPEGATALPAEDVWAKAQSFLRKRLSDDIYERWIEVIGCLGIEEGTLRLAVANDYYQDWLETHYLDLIREAVAAAGGETLALSLTVDRDRVPAADPPEAPRSFFRPRLGKRQAQDLGTPLSDKYTFESFVVGPSNDFAHAVARSVAETPARAYNPLFLYGGSGLGKTHLMQAVGHQVARQRRSKVCYMPCEKFVNEYVDALQNKTTTQFRKMFRSVDVLMIDDIHFLATRKGFQEEFFHTFNALYYHDKQIILTCDRPIREVAGLEDRLISRFSWGMSTELHPPCPETRLAILRNKNGSLPQPLDDDSLQYLALRISSNIRMLEGALVRLASYQSLQRCAITRDLMDNVLSDLFDPDRSDAPLRMEQIQRAVADHYDLRMSDMVSKRRPQSVAHPRMVAMYLCRELTEHSYPEIAAAFQKNHATVVHAHRTVQSRMDSDATLKRTVQSLHTRLTQPPRAAPTT